MQVTHRMYELFYEAGPNTDHNGGTAAKRLATLRTVRQRALRQRFGGQKGLTRRAAAVNK